MANSDMRGAFVLFEGLSPTVIDSQVLTHVRLAREKLNTEIPVIAFACTSAIYEQARARLVCAREIAGGDVHLRRGVRPALPGSKLTNRRWLASALDQIGPVSFVHARGDYAAAVAGPLAQARCLSMLWDCRGDSVVELRERLSAASIFMQLPLAARALASRRDSKIAGESCVAASFVSQQLRDLMAPHIDGKPSWVVPCLANENEFFFDSTLRQRMRAQLGFKGNETVYVYSGSLAGYQCFDEIVAAFKAVSQRNSEVRLLVLTPYVAAANKKLTDLPTERVVCKAVKNSEVNDYLNAADFGFLLRDRTPVNHVAFPTKFAEYALAGLQIIMKQDPPSCVDVARTLGNYVPLADIGGLIASPQDRAKVAAAAKIQLGRVASIQRYSEIYGRLATHRPN